MTAAAAPADRTVRLSVVVPCRDAAAFLPATLGSAALNAADDVEWVPVDDGSTDATGELLAAFAPPAGRAVVLTNPEPTGLAAARNLGTRRASGRYLTYLDADDWLAPGYLPGLADSIERLGTDFVRVDHVRVEGRARSIRRAPESRRERSLPVHDGIDRHPGSASMVDYPNAWSAVYDMRLREQGLLTVDEDVHTAEDRLLTWRLHLHAATFAVSGLLGYFYRRNVRGSLTAAGDDRQLHFFDVLDRVGAEVETSEEADRFRPKLVRAYLTLIAHHAEQDRLQPETLRRFRARARTTLNALPPGPVEQALASISPDRARLLRALAR